jgi:conserved repeat domain
MVRGRVIFSVGRSKQDCAQACARIIQDKPPFWLLLLAIALIALAPSASAQVYRAFDQRYTTTLNGDLLFLSNTNLTCNSTTGSCGAAINDGLTMVATRLPADTTDASITNSSSATLAAADLPAGAQIVRAQLYWGGLVASDASSQPSPSPTATSIRFGRPGLGYQALSASGCDVSPRSTIWGAGQPHHVYTCRADVTNAVRASGAGTYRVANLPLQSGLVNRFGGWTLVLVVQNPARPLRNFTINDGLAVIATTGTAPVNQVSLTVSGFRTPFSGTVAAQLGWMAMDGDRGAADGFTFQGQGSSLVNVSDACNTAGDVFNSTICRLGSVVNQRSVANNNLTNTLGFDADIVQLANPGNTALANGATSATLTARTSSEGYAISLLTTAIDVFQPTVDAATAKTQANLTNPGLPAGQARAGDRIRYTMTLQNTGQDNAVNVSIRDAIPANTDFEAGSLQVSAGANTGAKTDTVGDDVAEAASNTTVFRVGTGADGSQGGLLRCQSCIGTQPTSATVSFVVRVRADAADGAVIRNLAQVSYTGASSGEVFTESTNTTELRVQAPPRLTLVKTIAGRAMATDQFTIAIDNGGPSTTSTGAASSVSTAAFTATAGTTYTLSESGAGTPAANLALYDTQYSCVNSITGTTDVPPGQGRSFQVTPVAGDDLTCTFVNTPRTVDLSVTKTSLVTQVVQGNAIDYTVTVTHAAGTVAADGAIVRDTPGTGLSACTVISCTPSGGASCPATPAELLAAGGTPIPLLPPGSRVVFAVRCIAD